MRFPNVLSSVEEDDTRRFDLDIAENLIWFQGHFPGFPVLPGVVQLRWAVELAQEHFDVGAGPHEIKRLKFKSVIVPPLVVELSLHRAADMEIQFGYKRNTTEYSQGRLIFAGSSQ